MDFKTIMQTAPMELVNKVEALKDVKESNIHHPEMNAYQHTMIVVDRLDKTRDKNLILSAFFHDMGKVGTKKKINNIVGEIFVNHDRISSELVNKFSKFVRRMKADPEIVSKIVKHHMQMKFFHSLTKEQRSLLKEDAELFRMMVIFREANDMTREFNVRSFHEYR